MLKSGKLLEINLTDRTFSSKPFPEQLEKFFLAGRGFNAAWLYEHLAPDADPLGPDNPLLFTCGLLTGKTAPASSRVHVSALSPLTGLPGSSNVGGHFGVRMRGCGVQGLIIRGRADAPVYLYVGGDGVQIRPADHLWGLDTWKTEQGLRDELADEKLQVMAIGPAGENGVRYACIVTDTDHAAGRTGMGAVMGGKNLKAIVVKDPRHRQDETSSRGREAIRNYVSRIRDTAEFPNFSRYGGAGYVTWANDLGIVATRNFRENRFESIERIDGRRLDAHKLRSRGCYRCPVRCKAELGFEKAHLKETARSRPEFESMLNLGAKCGLDDLERIVYLDNLCTRLGIDVISAGNVIAFAMDLFERGILTPERSGGLNLAWGDAAAMEGLIRSIAAGEGFGKVLSQGVRRAADLIGNGAHDCAAHVKGLELAAYHPSHIMGTALGYAVSSRGGDFSSTYASMEYTWPAEKAANEFGTAEAVNLGAVSGKAPLIKRAMLVNAALDSLGLCKVPALSLVGAFDLAAEAELASALLGYTVKPEDLMAIGERIVHVERLLNIRFGAGSGDDRLPPMFSALPATGKESTGDGQWLEPMVRKFYAEMGWDSDGVPSEEVLKRFAI